MSSVFSALLFSSLPLWRPFGVMMLHKLWDILRFVVLTTSIGLGIVNTYLWRGNDKDRDAIANASSGGKEDSVSSKVPFVISMFYSELQPSDSFSDKEMEVSEHGVTTRRSDSGNGKGDGATMSAYSTADDDDDRVKHANNDKLANIDKLANDIISRTVHISSKAGVASDVQSDSKHDEVDGRHVEEPSMSVPSVNNTMKLAPTKGNSRLVKASTDDMSLGTVDHGNELVGKPRHRRGNSLEFPIDQEERARHYRLGDNIGPARDQRRGDVQGTTGDRPSSSTRKGSSLVPKSTSDHTKGQSDASSSSKFNIKSVPASLSTSTSKHSRSRSAYDLNDLLVYERRPAARISKPVATSQLARKRNVSLSCDLDKDYSTVGGVPAWLASVPAPPVPPPFDGNPGAHREILLGERVTEKQQDERSIRKAYTESLAPWRAATNAVAVNIPRKEATDNSQKHPTREEKKQAPSKDQSTKVPSPPYSPSTSPNSCMGSPSPGELKKKVDDFITRFHERMRMQRLESLERSRQAGAHSPQVLDFFTS